MEEPNKQENETFKVPLKLHMDPNSIWKVFKSDSKINVKVE